MGCISTKLLAKSGSFSEKVNQTFQRTNVLEEILISNSKSNGEQQFLAILCSTNLKPNSETSNSIEPKTDPNPPLDLSKIETINAWELLAGLEEEAEEDSEENEKSEKEKHDQNPIRENSENDVESGGEKGRSFRTIEDVNAILAISEGEDSTKSTKEEEDTNTGTSSNTSNGTKRKSRAKELAELKLPAFEFAKNVSLRDWLSKGGPIFSPGSYITPKFGSSDKKKGSMNGRNGDELVNREAFDPEMLAQFEEAIEEMKREESILREIVDKFDLEEGRNGEKKRLSMILEKDFIELNGQDIS